MKYMYEIFKLGRKSHILIGAPWPLQHLWILDRVNIVLLEKNMQLMIGRDDFLTAAEKLINYLGKAIEGKLLLDVSCHNIGYVSSVYNRAFWDYYRMPEEKRTASFDDSWQGDGHVLFSCGKRTCWIYNDTYGNIILEVTPYFNIYKCQSRFLYNKWLKNYKYLLKRIISPAVAQKWIEQMRVLLRYVRINNRLDPDYINVY